MAIQSAQASSWSKVLLVNALLLSHLCGVATGLCILSRSSECLHRSALRTEKINPSAKLHTLQIPLRPTETQMQPLSSQRDQLPQGRIIHALMLTYKLSLETEGKHRVTVPMLNRSVSHPLTIVTNCSNLAKRVHVWEGAIEIKTLGYR